MAQSDLNARSVAQSEYAKMVERAVRGAGPLQSLTPYELDLDYEAITRTPRPPRSKVWVRFGTTAVMIPDAELVAWTSTAYAVRFTVAGEVHKAWVWASAVEAAAKRIDENPLRRGR